MTLGADAWREADVRGSTAVVTGAAHGLGLALARRLGDAGMRILAADIDSRGLDDALRDLRRNGVDAIGAVIDVSRADDNTRLAELAREVGGVSIVCLNAGVVLMGCDLLGASTTDWEWVLGVNLWGAIHGTHALLPLLLERDRGRIAYTASVAALLPATSPYQVSKCAVAAFGSAVEASLRARGSCVRASTLYVGATSSDIAQSWRRRPSRWSAGTIPDEATVQRAAAGAATVGVSPDEVAETAVGAILAGVPTVLTHPEHLPHVVAGHGVLEAALRPTKE